MYTNTFDLQLFNDGATPPPAAGDLAGATPPPAEATPPVAGADITAQPTPPTGADITAQPAPPAGANIAGDPPADGVTPPAEDAPPAAPLELKFEVPDGFDQPAEAFIDFAKQNNLTQEQAQNVVDFYAKTIVPQFQQTLDAQNAEWSQRTISEFGNEGIEVAKQAFNQLATPELTKLLNDTGLGSHPEVVRLFNGIGKSISESKLILGKMNATKSDAQILFGDSVK